MSTPNLKRAEKQCPFFGFSFAPRYIFRIKTGTAVDSAVPVVRFVIVFYLLWIFFITISVPIISTMAMGRAISALGMKPAMM